MIPDPVACYPLERTDRSCRHFYREKVLVRIAFAVLSALLASCDKMSTRFVSGLSAEERAQAAKLPIYRGQPPEGAYRTIGPVEGLSCRITHDDAFQVSEENAIEELQRAAFRAGASAVTDVDCAREDRNQSARRCFRSIICRGVAVRRTGEASN